jgi:hypothetical protein
MRGAASGRPLTLIRALKSGCWEAARMAQQLDGDLLPEELPGPERLCLACVGVAARPPARLPGARSGLA